MSGKRVVTFTLFGHGDWRRYPPLPLAIVDADDQVAASGSLTTGRPQQIAFVAGESPLFARLRLPNGRALVEPLRSAGRWRNKVSFTVGDESPHEWMAWSAPRLDLRRRSDAPLIEQPGMTRAWMQLWELASGARRWQRRPILTRSRMHADEALQLELQRTDRPRALVVHLGTEGPRVFSLPQRETMVLVTTAPSLASDASPRVLIGGYGPAAEGILEFLRQGSMGAVGTVLDPGSDLAKDLLRDKMRDPVTATAAAYYLLRKRDWERLPQSWLGNLSKWFAWIPDAHLLRDVSLIQRGMDASDAASLAAQTLKQALARGWPLFAEAITLLEELLIYAERASGPSALCKPQRALLRAVLAAARPAGLTFGFLGDGPGRPLTPWHVLAESDRAASRPATGKARSLPNFEVDVGPARAVPRWPLAERLATSVETEQTLLSAAPIGSRSTLRKGSTLFLGDLYGVPRRVSRGVAPSVIEFGSRVDGLDHARRGEGAQNLGPLPFEFSSVATTEPQLPLVLVVDDSLTVRRVAQRVIERMGYRVALAKNGVDALERLAEETPAIILTDVKMPLMGGVELVKHIRADARLRALPVVMVDSRPGAEIRDQAVQMGAAFLPKPFAEDDLRNLLRLGLHALVTAT